MKKIIYTIALGTAVAGFISSCQSGSGGDMSGKMNAMVDSMTKIRTKALSDSMTMACDKAVMDSAMRMVDKMEAAKKKGGAAVPVKKVVPTNANLGKVGSTDTKTGTNVGKATQQNNTQGTNMGKKKN